MRSVEQQQALVTASAISPTPVRVAIGESQGLLCAEEVVTERPLPGFDQAAVDGYAVRAVDIRGVSEDVDVNGRTTSLPMVGDVAAGSRLPVRLQPGQAVRVDTGAPIPTLADAVVPIEWATTTKGRITVERGVKSGDYVRRVGDDVQPGDVAVRTGTIIGSAQVGLLAAVGRDKVLVHPRPRVAVISVGSELVEVGRTPAPGQVFDVNSHALAAAARDAGAEVNRVGIVSMEPRRLRETLETQLIRSEIVVISGAVGGIAAERVRTVLNELGELEVGRIAMHPGSVQGFGLLGEQEVPSFLLPSNPVGALVAFEVMVRPMIRIALGKRMPLRRMVTARTITPISSLPGRTGFLRGQLMRDEATGEYLVQALGSAGAAASHLLAALAEANSLIVIEADVTKVRTGDEVDVMFLAQRG